MPASPAPTELSDAATDIAPLADQAADAAVRSLDIIPSRQQAALTLGLSLAALTLRSLDIIPLTMGAAVRPRVLTLTSSNLHPAPGQATSHSLTLTLSR